MYKSWQNAIEIQPLHVDASWSSIPWWIAFHSSRQFRCNSEIRINVMGPSRACGKHWETVACQPIRPHQMGCHSERACTVVTPIRSELLRLVATSPPSGAAHICDMDLGCVSKAECTNLTPAWLEHVHRSPISFFQFTWREHCRMASFAFRSAMFGSQLKGTKKLLRCFRGSISGVLPGSRRAWRPMSYDSSSCSAQWSSPERKVKP